MKKISKVFGINVVNFKSEEIEIGNNSTGIKWENGVGKSYIQMQVLINLSTRLNYSLKEINGLETKETEYLANTSLNSNGTIESKDRRDNLYKKLDELYNKNELKHFQSFTGMYITDTEKDVKKVKKIQKKMNLKIEESSILSKEINKMIEFGDELSDSTLKLILLNNFDEDDTEEDLTELEKDLRNEGILK